MMMLKVLVKKSSLKAATAGGPQTQFSHLLKLNQVGSQRYFSNDN